MTRISGVIAAWALALAGWPAVGWAQSQDDYAARLALTRELLEAQGGLANIRNMMISTGEAAASGLVKQRPPEQAAQLEAFVHDVMGEVAAEYAPQMVEDAVRVWASKFTQQQLRDLLAFYRTPTGQALIAAMPDIGRESGLVMARYGPEIQLKVIDRACAKFGCPAELVRQIQAIKKQQRLNGPQ